MTRFYIERDVSAIVNGAHRKVDVEFEVRGARRRWAMITILLDGKRVAPIQCKKHGITLTSSAILKLMWSDLGESHVPPRPFSSRVEGKR